MLDSESLRSFEKPVHRRTVEGAGSSETVGLCQASEQLEVDLPGQPTKRPVTDPIWSRVPHAGLQVVSDKSKHLSTDVVPTEGVEVETIKEGLARLDPGFFMVMRSDASVEEGGRCRFAEVVAHSSQHERNPLRIWKAVET